MLFRGRNPDVTVWKRFRSGVDGFTFTKEDSHYEAYVGANAERVVDLFYTLSELLPPAVDVVIADLRSETTWNGESVALPDVRDAVARLKVPLATYGGVEFSLYNEEDQLTLTPQLELFIYFALRPLAIPASGKRSRGEALRSPTARGGRSHGIARRRRHFPRRSLPRSVCR